MLASGETLAERYLIKKMIGSGGMGTVYVAYDQHLDRDVALKVIRGEQADDRAMVEGMIREVRTAKKLPRHPNLLEIYDIHTHAGRPFIDMELGTEDLKQRWASNKYQRRFDVEATRAVTDEVLAGLEVLHDAELVHRDIKMENILFAQDGGVRISDYGISSTTREQAHAKDPDRSGTLVYMAPEQLDGKMVDARADLYAVGMMVYELTVGGLPFADDRDAVERWHRTGKRDVSRVPRELRRFVAACLAIKPTDRPSNASAARQLLPPSAAEQKAAAEAAEAAAEQKAAAAAAAEQKAAEQKAAAAAAVVAAAEQKAAAAEAAAAEAAEAAERAAAKAAERAAAEAEAIKAAAEARAAIERLEAETAERQRIETEARDAAARSNRMMVTAQHAVSATSEDDWEPPARTGRGKVGVVLALSGMVVASGSYVLLRAKNPAEAGGAASATKLASEEGAGAEIPGTSLSPQKAETPQVDKIEQKVFVPDLLPPSPFHREDMMFLGWHSSSQAFALKILYRDLRLGDEVTVVEVIDVLSHRPIQRYLVDEPPIPSRRASKWTPFLAEMSPGEWEQVEGQFDQLPTTPTGVDLEFDLRGRGESKDDFQTEIEGNVMRWSWAVSDQPLATQKLTVRVGVVDDGSSYSLLHKRIDNEPQACDPRGELNVFWAPTGVRALIISSRRGQLDEQEEVEADVGFPDTCSAFSFFGRTRGKQVTVVDMGSNPLAARFIARTSDAAGFAVAKVESGDAGTATSAVYYRGKNSNEARAVASALGLPFIEDELEERGWSDVVIVVGTDYSIPEHVVSMSFDDLSRQ